MLPGDGSGSVLVPVITNISFIDPINRYQEYQYGVDNSGQGDRDVHVDDIKGLQVERIDVWKYLDPIQRYQEKQVAFDNKTKGDSPPPYFITHEKTHVVRYQNTPDDGSFIDSELIDEFKIVDPVRQYQEYWYTLRNPPGEDDGQGNMIVTANPDDPDITDSDNGVDPPWRTDPFQNIVDWKEKEQPTDFGPPPELVSFWSFGVLWFLGGGPVLGGQMTDERNFSDTADVGFLTPDFFPGAHGHLIGSPIKYTIPSDGFPFSAESPLNPILNSRSSQSGNWQVNHNIESGLSDQILIHGGPWACAGNVTGLLIHWDDRDYTYSVGDAQLYPAQYTNPLPGAPGALFSWSALITFTRGSSVPSPGP